MYEKYIFSRECLLSLNFRALKRFNLLQALAAIDVFVPVACVRKCKS